MQNKKQMGRSMIEMLGVLAVIGGLSIGALVGFQYALNKHKANETLNDIQLWALQAVEAEQTYPIGQTIPTDDIGYTSSQGYNIAAVAAGDNLFAVELMNVPQKVCALLLKMAQNEYTIELTTAEMGSGTLFAGNTDECKDKPTLYFYFNTNLKKPTEVCLPGCASGESCCNNACYPTEGLCGDLCACPTGTECKGDGLCCLPESEACNGTCCPATQVCTNAGCACPEGAILNEEEQCVCPAGSMLVDGRCQSVLCTGSGSNYTCTDIYGNRCGIGCIEDGSTCGQGYCQNYCPKGTVYRYDSNLNLYGCAQPEHNLFCKPTGTYGPCYLDGKQCASGCRMDATHCNGGLCFDNLCNEGSHFGYDEQLKGFGCYVDNTDIVCLSSLGLVYYDCFNKDRNKCAHFCTTTVATNCHKGDCFNTLPCQEGWYETTQNGQLGCKESSTGIFCNIDGFCFNNDNQQCARGCDLSGNCPEGSCQNDCPAELKFQVINGFGNCYNPQTNVKCYKANSTYICHKNNTLCGRQCTDYYGSGCPDCFADLSCPANTRQEGNFCYNDALNIRCQMGYENVPCQKSENGGYRGCGSGCTHDGSICTYGSCDSSVCPSDMIYGQQALPYYGCIGKGETVIACHYNNGKYACYKDWVQCGTTCTDYTGAGCPECQA